MAHCPAGPKVLNTESAVPERQSSKQRAAIISLGNPREMANQPTASASRGILGVAITNFR